MCQGSTFFLACTFPQKAAGGVLHLNAGVNQERARHENKIGGKTTETKRPARIIVMAVIWTKAVRQARKQSVELEINDRALHARCLPRKTKRTQITDVCKQWGKLQGSLRRKHDMDHFRANS